MAVLHFVLFWMTRDQRNEMQRKAANFMFHCTFYTNEQSRGLMFSLLETANSKRQSCRSKPNQSVEANEKSQKNFFIERGNRAAMTPGSREIGLREQCSDLQNFFIPSGVVPP